jgi:hypothetical protein
VICNDILCDMIWHIRYDMIWYLIIAILLDSESFQSQLYCITWRFPCWKNVSFRGVIQCQYIPNILIDSTFRVPLCSGLIRWVWVFIFPFLTGYIALMLPYFKFTLFFSSHQILSDFASRINTLTHSWEYEY